MSDRKLITVCGATGAQGGGLARAILDDAEGGFDVRAITRKPDSEPAKTLAERGAEVVRADYDHPSTLAAAFEGAYGAYLVTNFWEHMDVDREQAQARALADAAAASNVEHVIWSTLEDTRQWVPLEDDRMPTLGGRFKVPHYDSKGEVDAYFSESGAPTTFLLTSFYWDNLIHFGMGPQRGDDGTLQFVLPMGDRKLPGIAVADIGRCAYGIFKEGTGHVGATIGIAGGHLTGAQMAAALSDALGEEVRYVDPGFDAYRSFGFPGAEDLGNMFQFKHDFEDYYCGARDLGVSRRLNPALQTFEDWLARHAGELSKG